MSIHFHPVPVKEIKQETADCVSVEFDVPDSLKTDFKFIQGQSLTMRTDDQWRGSPENLFHLQFPAGQ